MRLKTISLFLAVLMGAATFTSPARQISENSTIDSPSDMTFDNLPITSAIHQLAFLAGINILLDSKLHSNPPFVAANGKAIAEPTATNHWTNITAHQALNRMLAEHGLTMLTNPATPIMRVVSTNRVVQALPSFFNSTTNDPTPALVFDDLPLRDALVLLANQARLNLSFDPKLSAPGAMVGGTPVLKCPVKERWNNVNSKQAITALLDNFDLGVVLETDSSGASKFRVTTRQDAEVNSVR